LASYRLEWFLKGIFNAGWRLGYIYLHGPENTLEDLREALKGKLDLGSAPTLLSKKLPFQS